MTLLLSAGQTREFLPLPECMRAVERVFHLLGTGEAAAPAALAVSTAQGVFHGKAGVFGQYVALKLNGNFPGNRERAGLPTIQGVVVLCDAANGRVLAVMDSSEITKLRTGAATGVATKYLARPYAGVLTLCGCGAQADAQFSGVAAVRPLRRVFAYDAEPERASEFVRRWAPKCGFEIAAASLEAALSRSDIVVTCTTATRYFVAEGMVKPGTFIAAVGADSESKQEIDPRLVARSRLVCDLTAQCAQIGELHHALDAGLIETERVVGLGEIVAGRVRYRPAQDEVVIFDSTGIGLQDAAAAAVVFEQARAAEDVLSIDFAADVLQAGRA